MSDEFDDLRSLFDDEEDEEGHPAADNLPDDVSDEDALRMDTGELSGRLGQLDWQQPGGDEPDDAASSSGLGLTGQLDWQKTSGHEPAFTEDADDWMQEFAEADELAVPDPQAVWDDMPDWLAGGDSNDQPAEPDFPDWLRPDDEISDATHPERPDWQEELHAAAETPPDAEEWLAGIGESAPPDPGTALPDVDSDDFLNLFGTDELEQEDEISEILRDIGLGTPAEPLAEAVEEVDESWFADEEPAEPAPELPAWLTEIEDFGPEDAEPDDVALPANEDFFAELDNLDDLRASIPDAGPLQDIDSLLASYDSVDPGVPDTSERLLDLNPDIERLLADDDSFGFADDEADDDLPEGLVAELPDWLSEMGASVDELSAAALLRQGQKDRPMEELDERLQALHDAGLNLNPAQEEGVSDLFKSLLPGVNETLPPVPIVRAADSGIAGDLILTDIQRNKIDQLEKMVAAGRVPGQTAQGMSAIDRTYDSPFMQNVFDDDAGAAGEEEPRPEAPAASRTRVRRIKIDRLLVTLVVAAAVLLPFFVGALRIGDLPPSAFVASSAANRAFQQVEGLHVGDYVLFAAEYGPTAAAELDSLTDALLRHIIERGGRPVIISGNAVGLMHVNNLIENMGDEQALEANRDYYVTRYLAAGVIGTRAFARNVGSYVTTDMNGQVTNLSVSNIGDFALIVVVAERAEEVRAWAEQVVPSASSVPFIAAVSYAAAPMAEPYVLSGSDSALSGLAGMLVGYRDAYTYHAILGAAGRPPQLLPPAATMPLVEVTPEVTEPAESATPLPPTEIPSATPLPSETPILPTETPTLPLTETQTSTPTATETPLFPATFTPTPSLTPDAAGAGGLPVITGVINTSQGVNVRENPGREFAVVAILAGRSTVQITGRNGDESWYKILLEDGTEGWISASLVTVQSPASPTPESAGKRLPAGMRLQATTPTPEGGAVVPEATEETTAEVMEAATVAAPTGSADNTAALPVTMAYQDERWYSMTFGIIVIVAVITLGAVVNILRSLLTRRGRS